MPDPNCHAAVHEAILQECFDLIETVHFIQADFSEPSSDRTTRIELTPDQADACRGRMKRYRAWLADFLNQNDRYLSRSDVNLLETNADEMFSYVMMARVAQDVTTDMYKAFYRTELLDLASQQKRRCSDAENRRARRNMAARRRHWTLAPLTVGVEEEHQIVSTDDWSLTHDVHEILEKAKLTKFGKEVYRSQIEIKTEVCGSVAEVQSELAGLRAQLSDALPDGRAVLSAGAHPFSQWNEQIVNETDRTALFVHDMQDLVRRLVTFGMHVHVGIDDDDTRMAICNSARRFLPLLLSLSCSSPFWNGRVTGLQSYRSTVFAALPRTGIPPAFSSYFEFERYCNLLAETNSFDSEGSADRTKIWWDLRLHPLHPTLEFRICDACTTIEDAACITAICQAIVAKLAKLLHNGVRLEEPAKHIIEENKWRALRYGSKARFIDERSRHEVTARYAAEEMLAFVEDVLPDLACESAIRHVRRIVEEGCSAQKQIREYARTHDFRRVVQSLASQYVTRGSGTR